MSSDGWVLNEMNELELRYFDGSPFPTAITDMTTDEDSDKEEEEDEEILYSSSDDEEDDFDDSDWDAEQ